MRLFLILSLLCLSLTTWAQGALLTISSDVEPTISTMSILEGRDGAFGQMQLIASLDGKINSQRQFGLEQLRRGVVLEQQDGRDIIILKMMENFDQLYGGQVEVRFMINGLTKTYGRLHFDILREGNKWVASHEGKPIQRLRIIGNRKLGKTIGIARILF
jgi:hypothetical protein